MFAALKLAQQDIGPVHVAGDIGCHAFATFEPFSMGHSILGYGMSLASRAGVSPMMQRRTLAVMGDGGFWHNGLLTGVQSALFNGDDAVLVILKNGYTSATGTQEIISTPADDAKMHAADKAQSRVHDNQVIENTLRGIGVKWLRMVDSYDVTKMRATFDEAFTTDFAGLKVIIAEGECQLERQRRVKPWRARQLARAQARRAREVRRGRGHVLGRSLVHPAVGLSDAVGEADVRSAAGRSGRDGARWLRRLRLCGENAHAASLCPSFYRGEVIQNPNWRDRVVGARAPRGDRLDATGMNESAAGPLCIADRRARRRGRRRARAVARRGGDALRAILRRARRSRASRSARARPRTTSRCFRCRGELGGRAPVLSLYPVPGCIDLVVSSELLETGRIVRAGMASPRPHAARDVDQPHADHRREDGAGRRALRFRPCCSTSRADTAARLVAFDMEARGARGGHAS